MRKSRRSTKKASLFNKINNQAPRYMGILKNLINQRKGNVVRKTLRFVSKKVRNSRRR